MRFLQLILTSFAFLLILLVKIADFEKKIFIFSIEIWDFGDIQNLLEVN